MTLTDRLQSGTSRSVSPGDGKPGGALRPCLTLFSPPGVCPLVGLLSEQVTAYGPADVAVEPERERRGWRGPDGIETGRCADRLPRIPYLRLRFSLAARERAVLPPYHGSLLRGAFGHALRASVCSMGRGQACAACRLRVACPYTHIFETLIEGEPPPFLKGLTTAPRPYVFEPRCETETFSPGDPLAFDLLLFGQAAELSPYAILAVERMAAAGLGARRHRFALDRVEAPEIAGGGREVYSRARGAAPSGALSGLPVLPPAAPPIPQTSPKPLTGEGGSRAVLRFLTPTRLKSGGRLREDFRFRELAFTTLRRMLEIAHFHASGERVDWEIRPYLEQASAVRVAASDLRWQGWQRYSNRQRRSIEMGGIVGMVELAGDLAPFLPLLRTAEVLHLGKGATFGLGRVVVETQAHC
jgi:hypothetical protein